MWPLIKGIIRGKNEGHSFGAQLFGWLRGLNGFLLVWCLKLLQGCWRAGSGCLCSCEVFDMDNRHRMNVLEVMGVSVSQSELVYNWLWESPQMSLVPFVFILEWNIQYVGYQKREPPLWLLFSKSSSFEPQTPASLWNLPRLSKCRRCRRFLRWKLLVAVLSILWTRWSWLRLGRLRKLRSHGRRMGMRRTRLFKYNMMIIEYIYITITLYLYWFPQFPIFWGEGHDRHTSLASWIEMMTGHGGIVQIFWCIWYRINIHRGWLYTIHSIYLVIWIGDERLYIDDDNWWHVITALDHIRSEQ